MKRFMVDRGEDGDKPGVRFQNLIRRACDKTGQQAVVLIDEYDAPLLDVMREESFEPLRDMLQGFYKVLKESTAYLRFVFLTGITKFSQLSIFSALSNLTDISLDPKYAAICGITHEELVTVLRPEIEAMAAKRGQCVEKILSDPLLSHNFSEQRKLRIHNRFSHFGYEIIVENFV